MTSHRRITHLLLAALCVCLVIFASPLAHGQDAPATPEREQSATQTQPQTASDRAPAVKDERVEEAWEFSGLIGEIGWEDRRRQERLEKGESPYQGTNWSKRMHIPEAEAQTMCAILLDAFRQLEDIDKQSAEINHEIRNHYMHSHRHFDNELVSKSKALDEQITITYEEAVTRLKEALGEETFEKIKARNLSRVPTPKQTDAMPISAPAAQMPPRPKTE